MKSGLYAWAGASATASAAAWAKRFEEPITNESKVYFAFSPTLCGSRRCWASAAAAGSPTTSLTESWTWRSWPVASPTAARIRPMKWPSIQSRVKSFGTASTNSSSLRSSPSTWSNHVRYVVSLRAPLSRPATSLQSPSAVSSIEGSTPAAGLLVEERTKGEHSSVRAGSQHGLRGCQSGQKLGDLQEKPSYPQYVPHRGPILSDEATLASVRAATAPRFGGCL